MPQKDITFILEPGGNHRRISEQLHLDLVDDNANLPEYANHTLKVINLLVETRENKPPVIINVNAMRWFFDEDGSITDSIEAIECFIALAIFAVTEEECVDIFRRHGVSDADGLREKYFWNPSEEEMAKVNELLSSEENDVG